MQNPKVSHIAGTKRILRYIKGTLDYGILFPTEDIGKECKLVRYTNSSWCGDVKDRKFTGGYVFMLGGTPVAWSSRKELVIALSLSEGKYLATSLFAC